MVKCFKKSSGAENIFLLFLQNWTHLILFNKRQAIDFYEKFEYDEIMLCLSQQLFHSVDIDMKKYLENAEIQYDL